MLVLRVFFFCAYALLALAELKSLLLKRDELVTDLKNIMYRHADAVEKLTKLKADADKQMVSDMKQIRELAADHDQKAQQLADLEAAAQVVVDMVEDEEAAGKSLLERLREAPQRLSSFFSDTSRDYLAHALGLVKSFLPFVNLSFIGDGVVVRCSEEKFSEYVVEINPSLIRLSVAWSQHQRLKQFVVISSWFLCRQVSIAVLFNIMMYTTFL